MKIKKATFDKKKLLIIRKDPAYPLVYDFSVQVRPILKEIRKRRKTDRIRIALFNYLIVKTVAIFEVFLMNEAHQLTKENPEQAKKLLKEIKENIPLADQVVSTYSFMQFKHINQVFSALLENDFLEQIKNESRLDSQYYSIEPVHINQSKFLHENWDNVRKIFEHRMAITHHGKTLQGNFTEIRDLVGGIIQFMLCMTLMIHTEEKEYS